MARIFVSYSRADRSFVDHFISLMRRVYGNDVLWFDHDIHGGMNWWQLILDQIADCDLFVYLISNEALESSYCQAEFTEALRLKKQILPVIVRRLKPAYPGNIDPALADVLRKTQFVDMSVGFNDADTIATLYAAITHLFDAVPRQPVPPVQPSPTPEPPVQDKQPKSRRGVPTIVWVIAAGLVVIGFILIWQLGFNGDDGASITPLATTAVAAANTEVPTLTPTPEPSDTPPLSLTEIEQTLQAEMLSIVMDNVATEAANSTATVEQARQYERGTAAALTLTATQWTPTPMPDLRATAEARVSQTAAVELANAQNTATQEARNLMATAILWTATPTSVLSPLQAAMTPVANNDDWTPYKKYFNATRMVLVPAGCFMMGSDEGDEDEQPMHEQCFDEPFWIDDFEVTNARYGSYGCESISSDPLQPRNCVSWFEANEYCQMRDARLPTEAEWEYAARGPDGLNYAWGNQFDASYLDNKLVELIRVGSIPKNASWVGAFDLSGNIREWTSSLYVNYPYNASDGREQTGDDTTAQRVFRGGNILLSSRGSRAADRGVLNPNQDMQTLGFRCARDVQEGDF